MIVTVTDLLDGVTPEATGVAITVFEGTIATTGGGGGAVDSVNGQTGVVVLDATDVGADASGAATSAVSTHAAALDPHPGYLTQAEGDAAYDALGAASAAQTAAIAAAATDATSKANAAQAAAEATAAGALTTHTADTTAVHGIADTASLVLTDDVRLTNSRTPTAHATSHQDGGSDELALDGSQITTGTVDDARLPAGLARDTEVSAAVSTHEAASDPHTGYQKESEKGAASGYASLDGSTKVPFAQLPTGTGSSQVAVGDHTHSGSTASPIATLRYNPGSLASPTTTSSSAVALDTTNARMSVTPPGTSILVRWSARVQNSSAGSGVYGGVMIGATAYDMQFLTEFASGTRVTATCIITGLTAGVAVNVDVAWRVGGNTGQMFIGGGSSGQGPLTMEAYAL